MDAEDVPKCHPPRSVESDLRPVSLTSPIAKVLEGFTAKSLLTCVWSKLNSKQFALPGRSTTQALVYLLHTILETIDRFESVLEYSSPVGAGLTQYLSDQIESVQKRALKIIFPFMSYEDALKKSGLINLCQRREDACVTFLKRSYYSSDLLRNLVPRCQFSRPYALRAGRTVSVPTSSRSVRFGNFCTIKYQNHV